LPEDILARLESKWRDVPRAALEAVLAEAYRDGLITAEHLRRALGLDTRMEVDEFLKVHHVSSYTVEDFERDSETLRQFRNERQL
jgi:hypothetical protein